MERKNFWCMSKLIRLPRALQAGGCHQHPGEGSGLDRMNKVGVGQTKPTRRWTAGLSPYFHLPGLAGFHFVYLFWTHSHLDWWRVKGSCTKAVDHAHSQGPIACAAWSHRRSVPALPCLGMRTRRPGIATHGLEGNWVHPRKCVFLSRQVMLSKETSQALKMCFVGPTAASFTGSTGSALHHWLARIRTLQQHPAGTQRQQLAGPPFCLRLEPLRM